MQDQKAGRRADAGLGSHQDAEGPVEGLADALAEKNINAPSDARHEREANNIYERTTNKFLAVGINFDDGVSESSWRFLW